MLINERKLKDLLNAKLNKDSITEKVIKDTIYEFILNNYTTRAIIYDYIELALEKYKSKKELIDITQSDMEKLQKAINTCFRVIGTKADGTIETRGRKKSNNN